MVLEHAVLEVRDGETAEFERAFAEAKMIIAGAGGFLSLRLAKCLETEGRYVLLVEWESLEAHTEGFRGSEAYQEWRRMLHHFYEPMPTVEHFDVIAEVAPVR